MTCRICHGKEWIFDSVSMIAKCECVGGPRVSRDSFNDFDSYQDAAYRTAQYDEKMYPIASLMVESAELADLFVKPLLRGDPLPDPTGFRERIISEAGDVLWNLAVLLQEQGIKLSDVADYNIDKLDRRSRMGTIMGNGDR